MAMKTATDYIRGLRYKLRMMGIPIKGPTYVYRDKKSVLVNSSTPDSQLKKKNNSIAYHHICEGCTRVEWRITYIKTDNNPEDLLTKPLPKGNKQIKFCQKLLNHLYGG